MLRYSPDNHFLACGSHELIIDIYDTGFRGKPEDGKETILSFQTQGPTAERLARLSSAHTRPFSHIHARTHARTHARPHARTHARTQTHMSVCPPPAVPRP